MGRTRLLSSSRMWYAAVTEMLSSLTSAACADSQADRDVALVGLLRGTSSDVMLMAAALRQREQTSEQDSKCCLRSTCCRTLLSTSTGRTVLMQHPACSSNVKIT